MLFCLSVSGLEINCSRVLLRLRLAIAEIAPPRLPVTQSAVVIEGGRMFLCGSYFKKDARQLYFH